MVYGPIQDTTCVYDGLVAERCMRSLEADGFRVDLGSGGETEVFADGIRVDSRSGMYL